MNVMDLLKEGIEHCVECESLYENANKEKFMLEFENILNSHFDKDFIFKIFKYVNVESELGINLDMGEVFEFLKTAKSVNIFVFDDLKLREDILSDNNIILYESDEPSFDQINCFNNANAVLKDHDVILGLIQSEKKRQTIIVIDK